ncbi:MULTISPECIES: DUF397 domain-containing protein [Actinomadura]|uniref:DUF397 domain-containing protein n=1 Tax=Actinomadura yumaensis TaxID=111807 RepID=A0ABW2CBG5_9ACTN|nr:DUF397 domain-containing protein [Actinomadura sp. J1-007]MWK33945.1 DUF397 domain-containing protein [Actinomadura sp. J1-007]
MKSTPPFDTDEHCWRKPRQSSSEGNCVEVADLGGGVAVRDSKNPDGPMLTITPGGWRTLADRVKRGAYDLA